MRNPAAAVDERAAPPRRILGWTLPEVGVVAAGLVLLRWLAVVGLRPYLYFDSGEYERLDVSGRWRRPWATPLLYELVGPDARRRVLVQALLGAVCWAVLALAAGAWFHDRRVRWAVVAAIGGLGLTTSVTNWDTAILSESLALSLTALVLAAWLELGRDPRPGAAIAVAATTLPWLFVRQSLVPAAGLVALVAVGATVVTWRRGGRWRIVAGAAAAVVVLVGTAAVSYSRNREVMRDNLTFIVVTRVAPDADRLDWFLDEGMPAPDSGAYTFDDLKGDDDFVGWLRGDGPATYVRYLLTHPGYTVANPLDDLVGARASYGDEERPEETMLSPAEAYGSARPVLPEVAESTVFDPGRTGTILFALLATVAASALAWGRRDRRWALPVSIVGISLAALVVGWHGAASELGRLSIVAAVALRVGLVVQLGLLLELWLRGRRPPSVRPLPEAAQ